MTDSTSTISPKVAASALSGAVAAFILWGISAIFNITPPDTVVAGLPIVVGAFGGWLKSDPLRELGAFAKNREERKVSTPAPVTASTTTSTTAPTVTPTIPDALTPVDKPVE